MYTKAHRKFALIALRLGLYLHSTVLSFQTLSLLELFWYDTLHTIFICILIDVLIELTLYFMILGAKVVGDLFLILR